MRKKILLGIVLSGIIAVVGCTLLLLFAATDLLSADQALLSCLMFADICALAAAAITLKLSLAETLYSYKNIVLVGSIVFFTVQFGILCYSAIPSFVGSTAADDLYRLLLIVPRRFCYLATFVILVLSILVGISNIELMRKEGFRPTNALSILVAVFYVGGAALLFYLSDMITRFADGQSKAVLILCGSILLFLLLMLCYFECILIGSAVMGWLAARKTPEYDKDFIIILGCSIDKKGGLLPLLRGRVNRAMRFAWEQEIATGKPLYYVPSGGQGGNEIMSEGSAMELYLLAKGAESFEVFPEKKSATTLENMKFSKAIIDAEHPNAKIAFATTNYHVLRSGILARAAGFTAEGIAGDTKWYFWPNGFVREFFAILAMKRIAHLQVAVIIAALCAVVGCIGFYF